MHPRRARVIVIVLVAGTLGVGVRARQEGAATSGDRLLARPAVARALERIKAFEPETIAEQIALTEIPAPPFNEDARAEAYRKRFEALGLTNVRIDQEGNVIGERRGRQARPNLVFSAHLDTVFPEGTDVSVKRHGAALAAPGIGDDSRGLAVLLGVIRALNEAKLETTGTITFVGTVGEEGLGDLRGVKHLFDKELDGRIDRFVSVDGTGLGITHVAVGSYRYRVTFKGPGGHSYGAFGLANPIHALGRAAGAISDFKVPAQPKTTFNIGRIGGGTSVNAIPFEAWMEVDMRSADPASLSKLDAEFHRAVDAAVGAENARWGHPGQVTAGKERVGDRPAGRTARTHPVVQAAISVTEALGIPVELSEGSTDSNVAMSLGIPAVTIDGGGRGSGSHALDETFDTTESWKGTQRAFLLALALAEP